MFYTVESSLQFKQEQNRWWCRTNGGKSARTSYTSFPFQKDKMKFNNKQTDQ